MPNNFLSGLSAEERYISNLRYSRYISESIQSKSAYNFPFDLSQIQRVDEILKQINKPIILSSILGDPHIYFKYGYFTKDITSEYDCVLDNESNLNILANNLEKILYFNQYGLWCKTSVIKNYL